MRRLILALLVLILAVATFYFSARAAEEVSAVMLRYPDVSADKVVFVYDNDVWIVPKAGGTAVPLSSPPGQEMLPKFSPDGKAIAFTANYDGNEDVYTMPVAGGIPQRLTYHPATDLVVDYSPDGRVIFSSAREPTCPAGLRLYFASPTGALPEALPVAYGANASISDDGVWLAYTPWTREFRTWKRYQGGRATDLWLFNLKTYESHRITLFPGTDDLPMFHGDKIYFLSDAGPEHRLNIWVYDTKSAQREQVTRFTRYDVKWPSIGPDDLVFQYGDRLLLLHLSDHKTEQVQVNVPGDHPHVRLQTVDVSGSVSQVGISPQAKRLVANAHCDIWTLPAENGFPRDLNRTDGIAERYPAWSPDGQWIAYFSDKTGEYELCRQKSDGSGAEEQLTRNGNAFRYYPVWSPDSKKIAFSDKTGAYYVHDIDGGETIFIDRDPWDGQGLTAAWAQDSNWLAYTVASERNSNSVIKLYDLANRRSHQVTSDMFSSRDPAFDLSGEYLYFATDRSFSPTFSSFDQGTFVFTDATQLAVVPLRNDIASPFAPKNDEEEIKEEEDTKAEPEEAVVDADDSGENAEKAAEDEGAETAKKGDGKDKEVEPLKIDLEGLEERAELLPVSAGSYYGLQAGEKRVFYLSGYGRRRGGGEGGLSMYDLADQKEQTLILGASGFALTPDAKKMLVSARGGYFITQAGPGASLDKQVNTEGLTIQIDPRREWRQIIYETWRLYRDFFYDPNMHGVDWGAARDQALELVKHAANRDDVSYVLGEMVGELNVGHAYVWSWPTEETRSMSVGLLGCDFERAQDADGNWGYRIKKIYDGADWELDVRGPLCHPGVDVHEGDFLLAVNGIPLAEDKSPYAALAGTAEKTTELTVSTKAVADDDSRQVLLQPAGSDYELRLRAWIETNRQHVFDRSDGRIGYIYVRNTSWSGLIDLQRQFLGQHNLDGLIIDERWNGGGMLPDRFIELLNRPVLNYWALHDGMSWRTPYRTHPGPQVMMINESAGSGGDAFPYYFRKAGLGKLIGTRTWGGLVGLTGNPGLIDGGYVSVPSFGIYELDGTWAIEGHGVDPDIEVIDDPTLLAKGIDPQLERAIQEVLEELKTHAWHDTPKPKYPDRSGAGVPKEEW